MFSKNSRMTLTLLEPTLYIDTDSDSCNVIRGTITFNMERKTLIRDLLIRFNGKMETKTHRFELFNTIPNQKKILISQQLMIHPLDGQPTHHPLVLRAGVTEIGFEMKVPSRLPESVNCRDFSVNYQVSAHMECDSNGLFKSPLYNGKAISAQDILIIRLPTTRLITDNNVNLISDFRTYTSEWMDYQILVEKKTVSLGSDLPISFSLLPKKKGITIDHVSVQLLEDRDIFTSYTHRTQSAHTIVPFLNNKTNIPNTPMAGTWEGTIAYKVPSNISLVHSTKKYDDYNITHTLAVHLLLSAPSSKKSKVRCKNMIIFKTKIDLLAEIPNEHSLIELPPYHLLHPTGTIRCLDTTCYSQNGHLPCYESLAY